MAIRNYNYNKTTRYDKAVALYSFLKQYKTVIFFTGKRINKKNLKSDKALLKAHKIFTLTIVNNLVISKSLEKTILNFLRPMFFGPNLIAVSEKELNVLKLLELCRLPYNCLIPSWILSGNNIYNKESLTKIDKQRNRLPLLQIFLGFPKVIILLSIVQNFIYSMITCLLFNVKSYNKY